MIDKKSKVKNKHIYGLLFIFAGSILLFSLIVEPIDRVYKGYMAILTSPGQLLTDYIELGGIGATFLNASTVMLAALLFMWAAGIVFDSLMIASIFTLFGFSLFGKNLFNSLPISWGVTIYYRLHKESPDHFIKYKFFGAALGPVVSYLCFGMGLPMVQGFLLSYMVGVFIGFILPVLGRTFSSFHQGYTLYNIGFTCGIIGLFIQGILKSFALEVKSVTMVNMDQNIRIIVLVYMFFIGSLLWGIHLDKSKFGDFKSLVKSSGRAPSNFIEEYGLGATLINMGLLGIFYTSFVIIDRQPLNGPILGGIFTIFGFGAAGKHVRNVIPVLIGAIIAYEINVYEPHSVGSMVTVLFASNLAPIAGRYGFIAGMFAGLVHVAIVSGVGVLHGGLNLYNNGFAGGFVALTMVPIIEEVRKFLKKEDRL